MERYWQISAGGNVEFKVLGPLEVSRAGTIVELRGRRQRGLLAALLLRSNLATSVNHLTEAMWENPPAAPESNIRTYVTGLRRHLVDPGEPGPRLHTKAGGYLLTVHDGELDLAVFQQLTDEAGTALRRDDFAKAASTFAKALELWRGEPLEGQQPTPLLHAEVVRLQEQRLTALEQYARARIELGQHESLIAELRQLVTDHPLREQLWALLMLALSRCGRQADALAAFQQARDQLVRELGIEPGPQLRQLQERVLRGDETLQQVPTHSATITGSTGDAHRQLPMDIAEFTGREPELSLLHHMVRPPDPGEQPGTAVVICAIQGMAGVGKTRFAIRAAHQLIAADRFSDVQLWADLRGFTAEQSPTAPAVVLESFLRALGVRGDEIPQGLDARAALYRAKLAGRAALVLLDNAASADQVRPLLPGSPSCLVLITSRNSLAGLDGARPLPLDVFSADEAVAMVAAIVGAERVAAESTAAARIAELCGYLPIAITLAARRLLCRPVWSLADLVHRLEAADQRLNQLSAGTRAVRAAFDLSYRVLPVPRQQAFRLLGRHPGTDFAIHSTAALIGTTPDQADALLESLLDEHLLEQHTAGRYRFHDLLRVYASECTGDDDPDVERRAATGRVLGWYLHTAAAADRLLQPRRQRIKPDPDCDCGPQPRLATRAQALRWLEAERNNLVAAVHTAATQGWPKIAWQLPVVLLNFFYLRKYWRDWITTHRIASTAAAELGDRAGLAKVLNGLGVAYSDLGQHSESLRCHEQALAIERDLGDLVCQAWNLNNMGVAYGELHLLDKAAGHLREAVGLHHRSADRYGEGVALTNLGDTYRQAGRLDEAADYLRQALDLQRAQGDQAGQHFTLCSMGDVEYDRGRHEPAIESYHQAIAFSRAIGDRWQVAHVLTRLVRPLHDSGQLAEVPIRAGEALAILDQLGAAKAERFRDWLADHGYDQR